MLFRSEILSIFSRTALQVCEGQQLDMDFESAPETTMAEYLRMITLKTSVLIGASLQIGALCGEAPASDALRMYRFGEQFGIAFQIQDDLLDTFGNEAILGKPIGGDIRENKKSWLWIKAFEEAGEMQRAGLLALSQLPASESDQKYVETCRLFRELSIPEKAQRQIALHYEAARAWLMEVQVPHEHKAQLLNFLDSLINREY